MTRSAGVTGSGCPNRIAADTPARQMPIEQFLVALGHRARSAGNTLMADGTLKVAQTIASAGLAHTPINPVAGLTFLARFAQTRQVEPLWPKQTEIGFVKALKLTASTLEVEFPPALPSVASDAELQFGRLLAGPYEAFESLFEYGMSNFAEKGEGGEATTDGKIPDVTDVLDAYAAWNGRGDLEISGMEGGRATVPAQLAADFSATSFAKLLTSSAEMTIESQPSSIK